MCSKIQKSIKGQDLFGIPVRLTYKGQQQFNTMLGGCLSILLVATFTAGFFYQLHKLYFEPSYMSYPTTFQFETENIIVPTNQSTVAFALFSFEGHVNKALRVQFSKTGPHGEQKVL